MFDEDCCLQCGKPMRLDNRIYCSDACQALDDSPSLSTASSALPSPSLPPVSAGSTQEPSSLALGMSLSTAKSLYPPAYSIWYDEEDDGELLSVHPSEDTLLRSHDALSYARRPSSTNTHSTIPLLHRHSSSSTTQSSTGHSTNSAEEDSDISGPTCSSSHHHRRRSYGMPLRPPATAAPSVTSDLPEATVTSRKRNRASLPAYFSLLTLGAPHPKSSPTMSPPRSSVETARARPSPTSARISRPTIDNTHAIAGASPSSVPLLTLNPEEYRGRRREPRSPSRAQLRSRSRSRSRSRLHEWISGKGETRGRRRVDELDGLPTDRECGYGRGRSGLRDRAERVMQLGHSGVH